MSYTYLICKALQIFLDKNCDYAKPVLLGLSGGPDSLALLHLLFKCQQSKPFTLGIAHVDHGWREESGSEAEQLKEMAASLNVNFHLKTLKPSSITGNLEDACRKERLRFFSEICQKHGYQAVILGHHAGDHAETVLKRVLEGAPLYKLNGIEACSQQGSLNIWRPLLTFSKEELLVFIQEAQLNPIEDRTNFDPRFLRARMRQKIIPHLTEEFGKQVQSSMQEIGRDSKELDDYLSKVLSSTLSKVDVSPRGLMLDLENCNHHILELKYIVKRFSEMAQAPISRTNANLAAHFLQSRSANKKIDAGKGFILIDRERLFFESIKVAIPQKHIPLSIGTYIYGSWRVSVQHAIKNSSLSWKNAWKGSIVISIPEGAYTVGPPILSESYRHKTLDRWWNECKIPAFLRKTVPVIWQNKQIKYDFLTTGPSIDTTPGLQIELNLLDKSPMNLSQ